MADGMASFQEARSGCGLSNLIDLDRYCYYVAGVVGEMLTRLFCDYSPEIGRHREALMRLAVSFGQGLQMTNILKDIWEDRARGACWLPQDVFREHGVELAATAPHAYSDGFGGGLQDLVSVAHGHLRDALRYTLLIPKRERGIRRFCLWAIGMALLTLRKIARNPRFSRGADVKISRTSVKLVVVVSRVCVRNDAMLKALFRLAGAGLAGSRRKSRRDVGIPATRAAR
jgi:farnesyl-diphosphate farnesyltransferase